MYKKALSPVGPVILVLLVSRNARRVSGLTSRKIRVEKVKVLGVESLEGKPFSLDPKVIESVEFTSKYDNKFKYKLNRWVSVLNFDDDIRNACGAGIHGFITKQEAIEYIL
jgi:hypothetical protein